MWSKGYVERWAERWEMIKFFGFRLGGFSEWSDVRLRTSLYMLYSQNLNSGSS